MPQVEPWLRRAITFAAVGIYMLLDLFEEFTKPESYGETSILGFHHWFQVLVAILVVWCLWTEIKTVRSLKNRLAEEEARRRRLSADLSGHIADSFKSWGLTPTESEVAWLLIKGFQFAEIAELRGKSEKTLRQQASQIYAKARVKGRTELTASFLEDLLAEQTG